MRLPHPGFPFISIHQFIAFVSSINKIKQIDKGSYIVGRCRITNVTGQANGKNGDKANCPPPRRIILLKNRPGAGKSGPAPPGSDFG